MTSYAKFESLSIKDHPELDERWVQDRIAEDPGILGLGDVILKDKERIQPRAGRLDLLFQDAEANHRYEVEVQLGSTDESHIIRTIEYWDIERKRYPQYEHTAVIVAEIGVGTGIGAAHLRRAARVERDRLPHQVRAVALCHPVQLLPTRDRHLGLAQDED